MELQHENLEWNLLLLSYFHWILKIKSNIKKEVCTFQGLLAYLLTLISGIIFHQFSSVQSFGRVQFCDRPHESQHARPPCPSPTPGVHSDPRPVSQWCHPAISSSVVLFSSCPQSLPASESFPMSQLFTWGGQSIEVSALASVLPKKFQDWSPLEWTGWIFLQSKGLSRVFSSPQFPNVWPIHFFDFKIVQKCYLFNRNYTSYFDPRLVILVIVL